MDTRTPGRVVLCHSPPADGPTNMAADAAMLSEVSGGQVHARIYTWSGPWVSLGRFQDPADLLPDSGVPWVRRPTGGKAVLHGHDLTVAIAQPLGPRGDTSRSVRGIYRSTVQPLIEALSTCGLPAQLGETQGSAPHEAVADCFATTAPNDIVATETGRKVCGCALRVAGGAVLLQASIPVRRPDRHPGEIIRDAEWPILPEPWRSDDLPQALLHHLQMASLYRST